MKQVFLIVGFLLALFTPGYGQSETERQPYAARIIFPDKSEIKGEIVSENDKEIVIRGATLGLLTFQKAQIKKIVYLYKKGDTFPNPMPARYVVGQSAFNIPKGGLYLHSYFGIVSQGLMYGITDNLSAEAGINLPGLFTEDLYLYYGNLKYGFPIAKNLRGAVSFAHFHLSGYSDYTNITNLNALLTYGNKERNLTFGASYNRFNTNYFLLTHVITNTVINTIYPTTFSLRGMTRVGKRLALITENLMFEGLGTLPSVGLRVMWRKTVFNFLILINNNRSRLARASEESLPVIIDFSIKL